MTIISTNIDATSGNGVNATANNQIVLIVPNVYVVSETGYGVSLSGTSAVLNNQGTIAAFDGVALGGATEQLNNETGATISANYEDVFVSSSNAGIVNAGTMSAKTVIGTYASIGATSVVNTGSMIGTSVVLDLHGTGNSVNNSGDMTGAIGVNLEANAAVTVLNSGNIKATSYAIDGASAGSVTIKNTGSITGDLQLGTQTKLTNKGDIDGNVVLGNGANTIVNTGSIDGDVSLGNGGSTFNGKGGTVTGTISGGTGADKLIAGNDGEILAGGGGHDTMTGGASADVFAFSSYQATDSDIIHKFNVSNDTIQLDHTAFTKLTPDQTPAFAIGTAASSTTDYLFYNASTGGLFYDPDGSTTTTAPQLVATLDTGLHLAATNFTVV